MSAKAKAEKRASLNRQIHGQRQALTSKRSELHRIEEKLRRLKAARSKLKSEINDLKTFKNHLGEALKSNPNRFSGDRQHKYQGKIDDTKTEVAKTISKHQENLSMIEDKIRSLNEDYQGVDDAIYAVNLIIDSLTATYRSI